MLERYVRFDGARDECTHRSGVERCCARDAGGHGISRAIRIRGALGCPFDQCP